MASNEGRFAALDIGSNTVRIQVADWKDNSFQELYSSQIITRLGQALHVNGELSQPAMERTINGIEELVNKAKQFSPVNISAIATYAVRSAKNRQELETLFLKKLGFPLSVIEWEQEAELALKGTEIVINSNKPMLLFDIGGGSTEYIYKDKTGQVSSVGTNLGVVRLTETYIKSAPLESSEKEELEKYLEVEIKSVKEKLNIAEDFLLAGTAGTITSIAAIHLNLARYDPKKINNTVLNKKNIENLYENVGKMNLDQRAEIDSLQGGREDLIVAGFAIVLITMKMFGAAELTVSDAGLREGILLATKEGELKAETI